MYVMVLNRKAIDEYGKITDIMIKNLHIVCLAQPYPPVYGGAVEMFYKIKTLHEAGVKLILHVFLYGENIEQEELTKYASKIYYYKRHVGFANQMSLLPYMVKSRGNKELLKNLCYDDSPILFEGLHTCYYLQHPSLRNRIKIVRMHNIEHEFYRKLASYNPWSWKSLFFRIEAWKLERYEKVLKHANRILPISAADKAQLCQRYPDKDVRLMNCFFDATPVSNVDEIRPFLLYHGNLSIAENIRVAQFLISEIAPHVKYDMVIAGLNPSKTLDREVAKLPNVRLLANPSKQQMDELIASAHVNLLITFQHTGVKLKLLTSLYKGCGYVIANDDMLYGTDLEPLCVKANTTEEILDAIDRIMPDSISDEQLQSRRERIIQLGYNKIDEITELN